MSVVSHDLDELAALRAENERLRTENLDLSERNDALLLADLRLRRLLESDVLGVLIGNPQGEVLAINDQFQRLIGRGGEEIGKLDWQSCVAPEELPRHWEKARSLWASGSCPAWETAFVTPDGVRVPVLTGAALIGGARYGGDVQIGDGEFPELAENEETTMLMWALDISERKRIETELRESEGRMRAIVESIHDGLLITDLDDVITYANGRISEITGYSNAQLVGQKAYELLGEPAIWEECKRRNASRARGESSAYETSHQHRDGSARWMLVSGSPLRDLGGTIIGTIGAHFDITERKRNEIELARFADQLEKSNRDLEIFAFAVSHDLKEPLRKVEVFGSRLEKEEGHRLSPDGQIYLDRMRGAARRMTGLIDGLLAYSRVATADATWSQVDLNAVAREVMLDMELSIERAGADIHIGKLPLVRADATQMRQLLQNLIGNALAYRRPDVPLEVRVSGAANDGYCQIEVADNGRGFAPDQAETIFQIFRRLDAAREIKGAGVGLTICRTIAERHGGTLTAQGTPGEGAIFLARFPLMTISNSTPQSTATSKQEGAL